MKSDMRLVAEIVRLARSILASRQASDGMDYRERQRLSAELLRIAMPLSEALQLFQLPAGKEPDPTLVKKKYRELSFSNHPDRGGDEEVMKLINDAHDTLTKGESRGDVRRRRQQDKREQEEKFKREREERKRKDEEYKKILDKLMDQQQNKLQQALKKLGASLPSHLGDLVAVKGRLTGKVNRSVSMSSSGFVGIKFTMPIEGGSLDGDISVSLKAYDPDDIAYFYQTSFYLNRKQIRVQRGRHNRTDDVGNFANAKFMFPLKRVQAILKRAQPGGVMKRKDFLAALERELKAKVDYSGKDIWARIPLDDTRKLLLFRSTFMGQAVWGTNGIYEGHKRIERPGYTSFPESEDGLAAIHKYVRSL